MRVLYVGLSVRDARRSAEWYRRLFSMETVHENFAQAKWASDWDEVLLQHPDSGFQIGLIRHPGNRGGDFSEFQTGLDHLEFEVTSAEELAEWQHRLEALGIAHSGIKGHILTFRDPDNIQLEFFWPRARPILSLPELLQRRPSYSERSARRRCQARCRAATVPGVRQP